jgi:hypothetical protein
MCYLSSSYDFITWAYIIVIAAFGIYKTIT